jgi:hypothetical protein
MIFLRQAQNLVYGSQSILYGSRSCRLFPHTSPPIPGRNRFTFFPKTLLISEKYQRKQDDEKKNK